MKKKKLLIFIAAVFIFPFVLTACGHSHSYSEDLKTDATHHWYECSCGEKKDYVEHVKSETYSANETHHWFDCTGCGYDLDATAHVYDKEVKTEKYFKEETDTKIVYYKSCVCGTKGSDTFDVTKIQSTLSISAPSEIVYSYNYDFSYETNSNGSAVVEYKVRNADDSTYSTTKPVNAGLYTVRVKIAATGDYSSVSETYDFEIKKRTLSGLHTTVEYNGEDVHTIDLEQIEYGLSLVVTFDSADVNADTTDVAIMFDGSESTNYDIDISTCSVSITQKQLGFTWTAPANLEFDGTEKTPLVALVGVIQGDECTAEIEKYSGDNVWFDGEFDFHIRTLLGADMDNYKLPDDTTSDKYTVTIETMTVDVAEDVGYISRNVPEYYKIALEQGYYTFKFDQSTQDAEFSFDIYKKGETDFIKTADFTESQTSEVVFEIEEEGVYYVKCVQTAESEPQGDEVTIVTDNHAQKDAYGFCTKGCGTYLGELVSVNGWDTISLKEGESAYLRFADAEDNTYVQYALEYQTAANPNIDIKVYRMTNEGEFELVSLTETADDVMASFDDYYYIVATASADGSVVFQIEQTFTN